MIKILSIAILCTIIVVYLKEINSNLAIPALIVSGIIVIVFSLNYLKNSFELVEKIIEMTSIDNKIVTSILKITVIANLIEFTALTIEDFGLKSLSEKLIFCGKIIIFSISAPIFYSVFELIIGLLQWKNY